MAYRMTRAAGPWLQGQVVEDDVLEAHSSAQKFINNGAAVKVQAGEKNRPPADQAQLNDLDRQLAALNAKRDALLAGEAQQATEFVLPAPGEEANPNQDAVRAAGNEVIQPTSGEVIAGEVVPASKAKK